LEQRKEEAKAATKLQNAFRNKKAVKKLLREYYKKQ
jgi:hypothetical protein